MQSNLEYREVPFELVELKASDGGHEFTGYASTFGNVDQGGDVVMRGAFEATLGKRPRRPLLWQHDLREPIGVEKSLKADDRGLLGTWKIVDTARGGDAYKLLKAGAIDSMSIGYQTEDVAFDDAGVRLLKQVDLLECSVVSLPMNEQATVTSVKAEWTGSFVNNLPDSAFAVILPGGEKDSDGKTTPRSLRKLPHHGSDGKVDLPHLRNALSREPQSDLPEEAHSRARGHLNRHAKAEGIGGGKADAWLDLDVPFEDVLAQLKGFLMMGTDEAEALQARRAADERKLSDAHTSAIDAFLCEVKACAERLERLLADQRTVEAVATGGNWKARIAFARQLSAHRSLET